MNTKLFSAVAFSIPSLFAVGCSFSNAGAESGESSTSEVSQDKAEVTPGKFRLYHEANHLADPRCDAYTSLELTANGVAHLAEGLQGRCSTTTLLDDNARSYALRLVGDECGAKIYEGTREVMNDVGTVLATIRITDNRGLVCKIAVPAQVIVEETEPSFEGKGATTLYSNDVSETLAIECSEKDSAGALVRLYTSGTEITRAVYIETTTTESEIVADMNVCSAFPREPGDKDLHRTYGCNDVSWVDGFSVDLYEGGDRGPTVKLHRSIEGGHPVLVHELDCLYIAR